MTSTHQVKCIVCDQTYGNKQEHRCPFKGVDHANKHRETERRIMVLTHETDILSCRVQELERLVRAMVSRGGDKP